MADNISSENQQKINDLLEETYFSQRQISEESLQTAKNIKEARTAAEDYYNLQSEINKLAKQYNTSKKEADSLAKKISESTSSEKDQAALLAKAIDDGFKARRKQGEEINKAEKLQRQILALSEKEGELDSQEQRDLATKIRQLENVNGRIAKNNEILEAFNKTSSQIADIEDEVLKKQLSQYANQKKLNEEAEEGIRNKGFGLDTEKDIDEQLKKQLKTRKDLLSPLEKTQARLLQIQQRMMQIDAVKELMTSIDGVLNKIGASFSQIVKNVLDFDKMLTDSAKQLGISTESARELAEFYEETADNATNLNKNAIATVNTIKNQLVAQQELNKALGTATLLTDKARVDQTTLTKQMGLSAEEAAKLYKVGLLNSQTAEDVAESVAKEVISAKQRNDFQFDYKQVIGDVAKIEGQLAAQYENNPELIAKAVIQTKELGISLEQAANMANKLLDFSTSIDKELEAELLLGKQINLEQARELALRGDSAGAAAEMMKNVGGLAEFQKLNVIQQRSLAEAVGMTADELSNSLAQQEALAGTSHQTTKAFEEAAAAAARQGKSQEFVNSLKGAQNAEDLMAQAQQISNQEKFQMAIEKLQETLANLVAGPMGTMLDKFSAFVSDAENLKTIFNVVATIIGGRMVAGMVTFIGQLATALGLNTANAAAAIATASALTLGLGIVAVLAAIGVGLAALSSATGKSVSAPSGGGGVQQPDSYMPQRAAGSGTRASMAENEKPTIIQINSTENMNGEVIRKRSEAYAVNSKTGTTI